MEDKISDCQNLEFIFLFFFGLLRSSDGLSDELSNEQSDELSDGLSEDGV